MQHITLLSILFFSFSLHATPHEHQDHASSSVHDIHEKQKTIAALSIETNIQSTYLPDPKKRVLSRRFIIPSTPLKDVIATIHTIAKAEKNATFHVIQRKEHVAKDDLARSRKELPHPFNAQELITFLTHHLNPYFAANASLHKRIMLLEICLSCYEPKVTSDSEWLQFKKRTHDKWNNE